MKKIDWLEQFADDYNKTMKKTASAKKSAQQVIVDRSEFPKAVTGSLVSYANAQYKVVNAEFEDEQGPGMILEKVSDFEDGGCEDGTCATDEKECGDSTVTLADLKDLFESDVPEIEEETPEEETLEEELAEDVVEETVEEQKEDYYGSDKRTAPSQELGTQKNVTDAPYHPTGNPGNDFAVTKTHPDEYEDAARKTEEQIKHEDSQDRTTVDGYYTWNKNRILDRIVAELTGIEEPSVEELLEKETFEDEVVPEDESVDEEVFEDEETFEDEPVEESVLTDAEEEMEYQQNQGIEDQSLEINEIVAPEETAPVNEISNPEPPQQENPTGEFADDVFETVSDEVVEELPEDILADIEALEDEVIEELKEELFEGLEDEVIEEIKEEVLEELKDEVLEEIKEEVVEDVKEEVLDETPDEEAVDEEVFEDEEIPVDEETVEDEFKDEEIPVDDEVVEEEVEEELPDEEAIDEEVFEDEEIPEDATDEEVTEDDEEVEEKEEVASRKYRLRR